MAQYNTALCGNCFGADLILHFATFRQRNANPLCVYSVYFTRLISGEGDRAAELTPMAHSCVTVNADLIGTVRPET